MYPAIFLDRDGVIIENRTNYVRTWDDVEIYPHSLTALAKIRHRPYKIVIITNQSAIGRGIIDNETADKINQRLLEKILSAGGRIDGVFMCPHDPQDQCQCRKPEPGLIYQAVEELNLDLEHSLLIGDALTDLQAGIIAGVGQIALVCTGRGKAQATLPETRHMKSFPIFNDLAEALTALVE